jgi:homoserine dehydrogenase
MTSVLHAARAHVHAPAPAARPRRIALLGVGQVGSAVAALVSEREDEISISSGLVRDTRRQRPHARHVRLTSNVRHALEGDPDLAIEALGGLEPARGLVLSALERGIPVVTANKSLLAAHGDELLDAAAHGGVPLRYEAAVLAGVPFLGAFARRSLARDVTSLSGIVNGTTNFIVSRMADDRAGFGAALADAQRRGYAEPDPANDVNGIDAAEKLCVLARHFGDWSVRPADIDTAGISEIESGDIQAAADLGGALKPVVFAEWSTGELSAFAGAAFVSAAHPLARVNGVQNAIVVRNRLSGDLTFAGPGAGPAVTAATLLDDAAEIFAGCPADTARTWKQTRASAPATGWFVRLSGDNLPDETAVADLLSAYGVWVRRTAERRSDTSSRWFLTHRTGQARIADALRALERAAGCGTFAARILEA